MLVIVLFVLFSCLTYVIIKMNQIGKYTKESLLSIYITIPILCSLYSSLLVDVITSKFQLLRTIIFIITIISCILLILVVYPILLLRNNKIINFNLILIISQIVLLVFLSNFIPTQRNIFGLYGCLEKLGIIGIFISSILSGFSAISIPMKHLDPFLKKCSEEEERKRQEKLKEEQLKREQQAQMELERRRKMEEMKIKQNCIKFFTKNI